MPAEKVGGAPRLIHANEKAAPLIGLDPASFREPGFVEIFSGHRPFPGGEPLAMVYSGHQFGAWAGQLGDGRALLIAPGPQPERRIVGHPAQGLRAHALFAIRRRPRGDALHHPRISWPARRWRAWAFPPAGRCRIIATGETVQPRKAGAGRDPHPAGAQPYPLRPFRAFPSCRQARAGAAAGRSCDRRIFPRIRGRPCRLVRRSGEAHRRIDGGTGRPPVSPMA